MLNTLSRPLKKLLLQEILNSGYIVSILQARQCRFMNLFRDIQLELNRRAEMNELEAACKDAKSLNRKQTHGLNLRLFL